MQVCGGQRSEDNNKLKTDIKVDQLRQLLTTPEGKSINYASKCHDPLHPFVTFCDMT